VRSRFRAVLTLCRALVFTSALFACGGSAATAPVDIAPPSWTQSAPPGCAIGFSGPTLDPGDAVRRAREDALSALVSGDVRTVVYIESELLVSGGGQRGAEFTRQDISGAIRDAKIVAMWVERALNEHLRTHERHVYAMACSRGSAAARLSDPTVPAWILNLPDDGTRACALGVGGPTRNPNDQPAAALRDGRRALAAALGSELESIVIDTGPHRPRVASDLQTTERARARVESVDEFEAEWEDTDGNGPLGLKQTLYGLVCISL
jgi:hypothetical protein